MRSRELAETPMRPALSAFDRPHAVASARNALTATSDSRSRSASLAKVCGSVADSPGGSVLRLAMRAMSHLLVHICASFGGKSSAFPFSAKRGRWPEGPDGVWKAGLDRCTFAVMVLQSDLRRC